MCADSVQQAFFPANAKEKSQGMRLPVSSSNIFYVSFRNPFNFLFLFFSHYIVYAVTINPAHTCTSTVNYSICMGSNILNKMASSIVAHWLWRLLKDTVGALILCHAKNN